VRPSAADRHSYPHNAAGIATASSNAQEIRSSFFLTIYKSKVDRPPEEAQLGG